MAKRYVEEFVQWRHPYQWLWANAAARSAQTVDAGDLWKRGLQIDTLVEYFLTDDSPVTWTAFSGGGGTGDVVGPASATNSNLAAFDGTTGKLIKDSGKAYPTGTIVGTSDTQTLTNKSIAGSQITGSFTGFGATLATSRILGRSTAGTGAVEEISIGSGLSLSAGVLSATGGGGSGTVTSVAMTVPGILSVAGSPITTSGTLAISLANQNANLAFMGPTTGSPAAPTFRSLVLADLPSGVGLTASGLAQFAATTSAELRGVLSDETGTGAAVFATSPTLSAPSFSTIVNTGTLTLPTSTDTLIGRATTDTLTNKSIAGSQLTGAFTAAGMTMATARLLGRSTASTGAVEEITVGSGLSLSAGTLSASGGSGGASIITTPVNAAVGASTDQYCQVGGTQTIALANEARNRWYCPRAGTIQKMYVWINAAANTQPASGSYEITIYKNNATAGPTITIAAGATVSTVQSDTSTTLSVAAGDYLHIRLKNNATGTACNVACITFEIAF